MTDEQAAKRYKKLGEELYRPGNLSRVERKRKVVERRRLIQRHGSIIREIVGVPRTAGRGHFTLRKPIELSVVVLVLGANMEPVLRFDLAVPDLWNRAGELNRGGVRRALSRLVGEQWPAPK